MPGSIFPSSFIIIALVIFFPRTTKTATDVATGRVDKKAQIEQKVREIQEERENAPPEQKAAHGIETMHHVIREFKPELY